jgi:hypothetical protein
LGAAVFADLFIAIAFILAFVALGDLLLSGRQKQVISNRVIAVWNWLDDLKKMLVHRRWLLLFLTSRASLTLTTGSAIAVTLGFISYLSFVRLVDPKFQKLFLVSLPITAVLAVSMGTTIIFLILGSKTDIQRIMGILTTLALALLPGFLINYDVLNIVSAPTFETKYFTLYDSVFGIAWYCCLYLSPFLLAFWAVAAGPLIFLYAMSVLLYLSELLIRRIAEYPKGPILGFGALCGGIAGLLKAFGV